MRSKTPPPAWVRGGPREDLINQRGCAKRSADPELPREPSDGRPDGNLEQLRERLPSPQLGNDVRHHPKTRLWERWRSIASSDRHSTLRGIRSTHWWPREAARGSRQTRGGRSMRGGACPALGVSEASSPPAAGVQTRPLGCLRAPATRILGTRVRAKFWLCLRGALCRTSMMGLVHGRPEV